MTTSIRMNISLSILIIMWIAPGFVLAKNPDTLLANYTIYQCDTLIQDNANNPDFVILDIRTYSEYNPQHLIGAINRDFYNSSFNQMLNALPRNKLYLIHCRSGSRSANAFNTMQNLNFTRVVNMLGGILAWNGASFPTTSLYAPLHMAVSDTNVPADTTYLGAIDTLALTVTNRANDFLTFSAISSLAGSEFSTNFDTSGILIGADDYTFNIYYTPVDLIPDSIDFAIQSNGGEVVFHIWKAAVLNTGIIETQALSNLNIYPNPAKETLYINIDPTIPVKGYSIISLSGEIHVTSLIYNPERIDISRLKHGVYILQLHTGNKRISKKFMKL